MTVVAIDPSWIKTEDDVVIVKLKYNKAYYDEWARLVVVKNDGDYNDFYVEFDKRDFNIHFRAGVLMEKWGCKTVKELTDLNLSVQLWNPELGDNSGVIVADRQIGVDIAANAACCDDILSGEYCYLNFGLCVITLHQLHLHVHK